jgi:4-aminobutyrate aminotransferase/(S)-3-amino-2-methylpropionate transaminase
MDSPEVSGLGGTYSGNPIAIAAAHAVLDRFEQSDLIARAEAIGARIEARMREWAASSSLVGEVRRLGAMIAIELVKDRATKEPNPEATAALAKACHQEGLLILTCGTYGNVLRFLPPLVIGDDLLGEGLDIIEQALARV